MTYWTGQSAPAVPGRSPPKCPETLEYNQITALRSDTVTLPTQQMLEAMASAPLGDDVYRQDPTVRRLEELAAEKIGKEPALVVPTGTMGNLIAMICHTRSGKEL